MTEQAIKCRNCSAPISPLESTCEYCGTIVNIQKYNSEQDEKKQRAAAEKEKLQIDDRRSESKAKNVFFICIIVVAALVIGIYLFFRGSGEKASPISNVSSSSSNASTQASKSLPGAITRKIAPSFDCNKARSESEKIICNDDELAQIDLDLAKIYARAKDTVVDKETFKQQSREAWQWRERNCYDKNCLLSWYADRKASLLTVLDDSAKQAATQKSVEQRF